MPSGHHNSKGRGQYDRERSDFTIKCAFKLRERTWRTLHELIAEKRYSAFIDAVLTKELSSIYAGTSQFQQYTKPE